MVEGGYLSKLFSAKGIELPPEQTVSGKAFGMTNLESPTSRPQSLKSIDSLTKGEIRCVSSGCDPFDNVLLHSAPFIPIADTQIVATIGLCVRERGRHLNSRRISATLFCQTMFRKRRVTENLRRRRSVMTSLQDLNSCRSKAIGIRFLRRRRRIPVVTDAPASSCFHSSASRYRCCS